MKSIEEAMKQRTIYEWVVYQGVNKDFTKAHLSREPYKMTACGRLIMTGVIYEPTIEWNRCGQCLKIERAV